MNKQNTPSVIIFSFVFLALLIIPIMSTFNLGLFSGLHVSAWWKLAGYVSLSLAAILFYVPLADKEVKGIKWGYYWAVGIFMLFLSYCSFYGWNL